MEAPTMFEHFNSESGAPLVRLNSECVADCSAPGQDASEACSYWLGRVDWLADSSALRDNLRGYGAWDDLDEASEETLRTRSLWVAAVDCREDPECYATEGGA